MFIRVITFDEACRRVPDANSTSWNSRAYWLYDLQKYRWDWPVWGNCLRLTQASVYTKRKNG